MAPGEVHNLDQYFSPGSLWVALLRGTPTLNQGVLVSRGLGGGDCGNATDPFTFRSLPVVM